jgi:hypothetical protein
MGLVWRPLGLWHWLGTPPGWRRPWAKATCMAPSGQDEYWVLILTGSGRHIGHYSTALVAMRYADSLWDAVAVAKRL